MKTIVLVEDDKDIREALEFAMNTEGYGVVSFEHSALAWDYLSSASKNPNLVLLDLMTPIMTGWQFLEKARLEKPIWLKTPIVVFSAASLSSDMDLTPAVQILKKPIDLVDLFNVVEKRAAI